MKTVEQIQAALADPFPVEDVAWKAQSVKGDRALAVAFIDARDVMDRLDAVVGAGNWQDEYQTLECHSAVCKLSLRIEGEWIAKVDVGSPSDQPDEGDRVKASFSDALKRAAVKFGVGRYLYRLPATWCDYDPVKKQFKKTPTLPAFAHPQPKPAADLPAKPTGPPPKEKPAPPAREEPRPKLSAKDEKDILDGVDLIGNCASLPELKRAWTDIVKSVSPTAQTHLVKVKDKRKADLSAGVTA